MGVVGRETSPNNRLRGRERENARHEHRAPETVFSVWAFEQSHFRADCLPQEHLAWEAQTQAELERPQQVLGSVIVILRLKGGLEGVGFKARSGVGRWV